MFAVSTAYKQAAGFRNKPPSPESSPYMKSEIKINPSLPQRYTVYKLSACATLSVEGVCNTWFSGRYDAM